jgi:peptidyl-prolyl cis-trans isomerase D
MARSAGNSVSRTVMWVILLLLIVGLAGFGAVSFTRSARAVGMVGDTPIAASRYVRQVSNQLALLRQQTGADISMAQAQAFGLDRQALESVIGQVAVENEAARIGLSVGDAEVREVLVSIPGIQGLDGKYDEDVYRDMLRRNGETVASFEDQLRAEGARRLLGTAVIRGVAMPPAMADLVFAWQGERRSFTWVELTEANLSEPVPAPTDAQLEAHYTANPDAYTLPEARAITYAWITPSMLAGKVEVDEAELQKLYAAKAEQYDKPETRLVERLVFPTADAAQEAWDRIQSGAADFDALVVERGLTLDDVDLGDMTREALGPAGEAVFALAEPGLVGPVDTDLGPAIIRMNGILGAEVVTFEQARPELAEEYSVDRARRMIGEMVEQVNDMLAGGATLEEVAEETDLELGTVEYSEEVSEGIAGYAAFRAAAAQVEADDFAEVEGLDDGGIFALRLDRVIEPRLQPLAEVRDRVAADWKTAEVKARLAALADGYVTRLEAGEDPAAMGLKVNAEGPLTRNAFLADTPAGLLPAVFRLEAGKVERIDGTEGTATVALVRTDEVLQADPADTELAQQRDAYAASLDQSLAADLMGAVMQALLAQAGLTLDNAALAAVNAGIQ